MASIAYVSPMPPARTGIAGYSSALVPRLRAVVGDRHTIKTVWPLARDAYPDIAPGDLPVYHIGNNLKFHREIYSLAIRRPGVVVLHDLALDDLVAGLREVQDPLSLRARREARMAAERLAESELELDGPLVVPSCAHLVRRARGIIVHSQFGRRYLKAFGCLTPTYVAPHPAVPPPSGWRARRADRRVRERLGGGGVVVGVLGDMGAAKGIDAMLGVVRRIEGTRLVIVGRRIPGFDAGSVVAQSGLGRRVILASDVSDEEFAAWLRACDIVVNLRHPHRGEVSGTLIRAMHAGLPAIVSATGTYLDFPEGTVVPVPAGPPDAEALVHELRRLAGDAALRQAIGARARAHVQRLADDDATARAYALAIDETLALLTDPLRRSLSRWASVLTEMGATGATVRRGLGVRYADALADLSSWGPPGSTS